MRSSRGENIVALVLAFALFKIPFSWADTPIPTAVAVPVRTNWWGYDGSWSPVSIRIGTPPVWVDVLVSTAGQETVVVGPGGCYPSDDECARRRGGIFAPDGSSTWREPNDTTTGYLGYTSDLGLDRQLGFRGQANYGLDNISLSDTITLPQQIIAVINDTSEHWLGFLGLGIKPTYFTETGIPTYLASMVENKSYIPSHSYGFTAGAQYRLKGIGSSLTLGGYDPSRFEPHNISFKLDPNQDPTVAINKISVTANPSALSNTSDPWKGEAKTLLDASQADLFKIDSSTPFLWLPEAVCTQFEDVLGLTYDEDLRLYKYGPNSRQHDVLANWNLTFQFQVADLPGSSNTVQLNLPFDAFNLNLSYPYPGLQGNQTSQSEYYFPLRRAINDTQYTLGRAFLQEVYLMVDYERGNFSVHQTVFNENPISPLKLVDIPRLKNSTLAGNPKPPHSGLSNSGIAGVVVGGFILALGCVAVCVFCFRRRTFILERRGYIKEKDPKPVRRRQPRADAFNRFLDWLMGVPEREMPAEIGGSQRFAFEAADGRTFPELPTKHDRQGYRSSADINSSEPTAVDMHQHSKAVNAIGHDPDKPVELPYRSSHRGFFEPIDFTKPPPNHVRSMFEPAEPPTIPFGHPDRRTLPSHTIHPIQPVIRRHSQDTHVMTGISSPSSSDSSHSSKGSSPIFVVSPVSPEATNGGQYGSLLSIARRAAWYVSNNDSNTNTADRHVHDPDPQTGTNHTQRSGESAESGVSPEDSVSQSEISRRSTVSPIDDFPSRLMVPTIQEQLEPDDNFQVREANSIRYRPATVATYVDTTTPVLTSATGGLDPASAAFGQVRRPYPSSQEITYPPQHHSGIHGPRPTPQSSDESDSSGHSSVTLTRKIRNSLQRGYRFSQYPTLTNNTIVSAVDTVSTNLTTDVPPSAVTATPNPGTDTGTGTGTGTGMLGHVLQHFGIGHNTNHNTTTTRRSNNPSSRRQPYWPFPPPSHNSSQPPTPSARAHPTIITTAAPPTPTTPTPNYPPAATAPHRGVTSSIYSPLSPLSHPTTTAMNTPTITVTSPRAAMPPMPPALILPRGRANLYNDGRGGAAGGGQQGVDPTISVVTEQSTYSPARWIEFWRTGRDPREPRSPAASAGRSRNRSQLRGPGAGAGAGAGNGLGER